MTMRAEAEAASRARRAWGRAALPLLALVVLAVSPVGAQAQPDETGGAAPVTARQGSMPALVAVVTAEDTPNDGGDSITLSWTALVGAEGLEIAAGPSADGPWTVIAELPGGATGHVFSEAENGQPYYFRVVVRGSSGMVPATVIGPVEASAQWFDMGKIELFILGVIISGFIIFFIGHARRGGKLFIRKIAGLEAIDEAIGRSVEMGRPILFVPGIQDLNDVQTLAGLTILGHVSRYTAEYDTQLNVPVSKSLVLTAGREVIQQAYLEAGRPDAYNDNMVHYLTDEQFAYVAGINGIIVRDKPATCFYQGAFFAESLILAETGNAAGAIQIAGTANSHQLPFFVAACDYTLIGEELFAASAYLSGDPQQLGSLKGQDVGKLIAMVTIVLGSVVATAIELSDGGDLVGVLTPVMDLLHDIFR